MYTSLLRFLYLTFVLVVFSGLVNAQTTYSWRNDQNPTSGQWNNSNYWWNGSGAALPGGAEILFLDGNVGTTMTNDLPSTNRFKITFGSTDAAARTINGTVVNTFYEYGATWPRIENDATGITHTINFPINASTNSGFNFELVPMAGPLVFGTSATINNNGRTIQLYGNNSSIDATNRYVKLDGIISGSGILSVSQAAIAKLNAVNTYTGQTQVDWGELWIESGGDINTASDIYVGNGGAMANVTKFFLTNSTGGSTFTRNINMNAGNSSTRFLGGLNTAGTNTFSGTVTGTSSDLNLEGASGGTVEFSGIISGMGALKTFGAGTIKLSAANTFTGAITVNSPNILQLGAAGDATNTPLGTTAAGTTITSGGALDLGGFTLGTAEGLTLSGTGVSSSGVLMNSGSAATYSGLVTLGAASTINGGTGTITLSNTGTITGDGFGLTLGGAVGGSIASIIGTTSGTLTKADAGTWTLTGANTYTGTTTITDGELRLNPAANSTPASQIILNGGTLSTTGITASRTIISSATLQLDNNSTIALGSNAHTLQFAASDALTWAADKTITITGWTGTAGATGTAGKLIVGTTTSGLTAAQLAKISFSGYTGTAMMLSTGEVVPSPVNVAGSTGANGSYATLKAAFDAINTNTNQSGNNIIITLAGSTAEPASASLTGQTSNTWTSLKIYPTVTSLTISGNLGTPLIELNGADNVTIDGRVDGIGSTVDLTISNASTSTIPGSGTSTIGIVGTSNSADNNTIKYCIIKGSTLDPYSGIVFLYTSAANTIITNNNITSVTDANRPLNAIYSAGSAITVTISNNNIYDFLNRSTASYGVNFLTGTNTSSIIGNSFYETTSFGTTANVDYTIINIYNLTSSFTISGNFIGGNAPLCSGTWIKANTIDNSPPDGPGEVNLYNNTFYGIVLNVSAGTETIVQDNTIKGFNWSNATAAGWAGINALSGKISIGSLDHPNTIGATTGTGSITLTNSTSLGGVGGINLAGSGYITCDYNTIGSITAANTDAARSTSFIGIHRNNTNASGSISHNIIGSTSTANSINATSTATSAAQPVIGIWNDSIATTGVTIDNNTIANMTNATTNATVSTQGVVNGIYNTDAAVLTISNNSIHDLTIANANTTANASASGIAITQSTQATVTSNSIYNLSNTYPTYAGYVSGIFFAGGAGANICSNNTIYGLSASGTGAAVIVGLNYNAGTGANVTNANFIHSLSVPNSSTATIIGIRAQTGVNTYSNNIISLGGAANITQIGFYDIGAASQTCNLYYNTISISGTVASGSNKTYCLFGEAASNTRNFRNNIFSNTRSTTGGTSLHYAVLLPSNSGLTSNYNDYFVSGTGGMLGYYGVSGFGGADMSTLALWKTATSQDANSFSSNPLYVNDGGVAAVDYESQWRMNGATDLGITTDYASVARGGSPIIGAWEQDLNLWTGTTSSVYSVGTNWSKGAEPTSTENIVFAASPTNNCILDGDKTVANVINQSTRNITIPTAKTLTVTNSITTDGNTGRILIQANSGAVNGSLIYHNTVDNPVYATVEMFDKATIVDAEGSTTSAANYHWQYFGIPVRTLVANPTFYGSYVRRWNHPTSTWSLLKNDSVLSSFKGYEVAQTNTKTITFAGALENGDYSATLDAQDGATTAGQYLFSNPYTAAINIDALSFGAQTENSVYLFNTGSTAETNLASGTYTPGTTPGQYIVCPKGNAGAGGIPSQIPSMAGFVIKDTNVGGTHSFGITYNTVIQANTTTQRAKKVDTSVYTIVDVKGARYADRMWVFTKPECTRYFDNGWDGRKMLGLATTPQLYAMEEDGDYQVNTVSDINNTDLAFQAGEDSIYTLTFTHQNTESAYSNIYLVDLRDNKTTDISATGTEYSFTAESTAAPTKRFKIVTASGEITGNTNINENELSVFGIQNYVMVHNFRLSNGIITLYDLNGTVLQETTILPLGITTLTTNLPDGCYVVKAKTENMEVTKKVILNKSAR